MNIEPFEEVPLEVASPCVRNCCLDQQDICLGCYRHIDEIMAWKKLDSKEKNSVLLKCQQRERENEK